MKDLEKLKDEQVELKGRLVRVIDFINSGEFYTLDETEKSLLMSQRAGMEIYLNSLTQRIYGARKGEPSNNFFPLMLLSMLQPFPNCSSSTGILTDQLNKEEEKDEKN